MKLSFVWAKMIVDLMFVLLGDIIIIEYYDLVSVLTLILRETMFWNKTKAFINSVDWLKYTFYIDSLLLMSQNIKI